MSILAHPYKKHQRGENFGPTTTSWFAKFNYWLDENKEMSRNDQLNITDEAALLWLEANRFDAANVCARRKLSRLSTSHAEQPFPLLLACESGNVPLCQWLLDHGAAPTLSTVSNHRWTPMSKYPISPSCYFDCQFRACCSCFTTLVSV